MMYNQILEWKVAMSQEFTLTDLEKAAPRVLERLRALADLPQYGTVAGQSVASLFWEELGHPVRGPINDIDIFINSNMPRSMRGLKEFTKEQREAMYSSGGKRRVNGTSVHMREIGMEHSHYDHVKFIALRATTTILSTYQVGLINYTLIRSPFIRHDQLGHGMEVSKGLIEGFDLNMVGVGINLESGQVVATEGFIEFLNSHKIRVETCNTPAHSMIRLANKYFGGQIQNAQCDFMQERQMLEVAIACQTDPVGNTSNFHQVLHFGGGKYKALYDRYEKVLPPIVSTEKEVAEGQTYTLYSMQPATPVLQSDLDLQSRAHGVDRYPSCVSQHIYVADFPRIYELVHPERSLLSPNEISHRRAAFEKIDKDASDGHNIRCMQVAMGRPAIELKVGFLDDDESVVFFFNQECAKDPVRAHAAAQATFDLSDLDRHVVHREGYRADTVLLLSEDRSKAWKTLLRERGPHLINTVSSFDSNNKQCTKRHAQMYEILGWMKEMGIDGTAIANRIIPVHHSGGERDAHLNAFLAGFPSDQQPKIAREMMEWVMPSWPNLGDEQCEVRRRALSIWVGAGQSVPPVFWEYAKQEDLPAYLLTACDALRNRVADHHIQTIRDNILHAILPRLTDEQMALNKAMIIRACLCVEGYDALQSALTSSPDSALLDTVLSQALEKLDHCKFFNNENMEHAFSPQSWGRQPTDRDRVAIDGLVLARATHAIQPPPSAAPRRSKRL
jgi:hypothetical protein